MGLAGSLGRYGFGLGFLYNAFASRDGEGGLTLDSIAEWAETFGMDASFLEEGIFHDLLDGREGPLSMLLGSLTVLPDGMKKWGVYASLAWIGASLYQDYTSGKLDTAFSGVARGRENVPTLTPEQVIQNRIRELDINTLLTSAAAQVDGQNLDIQNGEVADLGGETRELDGRELVNE